MSSKRKTHPGVEYAVDDTSGKEHIFKTFDEAAGFAVAVASSGITTVNIDVLCFTRAGAKFVGLEEEYDEDPEASVTQRIEVSVDIIGRVP